jgi:thioredoxin reductase
MYTSFEVIIIGGSYAGLSAAMALGRASRNTLVIDSGKPCNRNTPHSHNFITQDGETPASITAKAKQQVAQYPSISFASDHVVTAEKTEIGFMITTASDKVYQAKNCCLPPESSIYFHR